MRTQVCIIGGGPSGLLLSHLLHRAGIDTVILERRSRAHVLSRIRAGVLEEASVALLSGAGLGAKIEAEGTRHGGCRLSAQNRAIRIDYRARAGRAVMVYGQTEVTADLYAARDAAGGRVIDRAEDVAIDLSGPACSFARDGKRAEIRCDFIAGCDGFHGIARRTIPAECLRVFERAWPFGWLGILSQTPPVFDELIYANHERGFALCSQRSPALSRYYLQCAADEDPAAWSDDRFWDELRARIPHDAAEALVTGPSVEKSVAPLRSFVAEPMRHGPLFLAGDAAHIVPPTGAKGLNLALSDVAYLSEALIGYYQAADEAALDAYSDRALARVWAAMRFSWWFTALMHRFPGQSALDQRLQEAEIAYLAGSDAAQTVFAEQYVGMPL